MSADSASTGARPPCRRTPGFRIFTGRPWSTRYREPMMLPSRTAALPALVLAAALVPASQAHAQVAGYVPPAGHWEEMEPARVGLSAAAIHEAVRFAVEQESTAPRDLALAHQSAFSRREPFGDAVGPFSIRGPASGMIVRGGYVVAEWGEPDRVDLTFSVAKSFVSATVGMAWDRGLIESVDERVADRMAPIQPQNPECVAPREPEGAFPQVAGPFFPFSGEHNGRITWDDLLRQSSDWEGMLWCKPDWADRPDQDADTWLTRERHEPGTVYEYNDVRVNLLALASTNLWRRPLPQVLREHLMDPIGASPTWRWLGYDNSWILLDGVWVQAVSGGSHWGGGMFISARDLARFGLLHLRDGSWGEERILSTEWLAMARTPGPANDGYGFMNFFLNTGQRALPAAPESAYYHLGAGVNMVYVDPDNDLVVVARWLRQGAMNEFIGKVLAAVER
jgi:CubicO group peptidase (beta-lactamase class C family)